MVRSRPYINAVHATILGYRVLEFVLHSTRRLRPLIEPAFMSTHRASVVIRLAHISKNSRVTWHLGVSSSVSIFSSTTNIPNVVHVSENVTSTCPYFYLFHREMFRQMKAAASWNICCTDSTKKMNSVQKSLMSEIQM